MSQNFQLVVFGGKNTLYRTQISNMYFSPYHERAGINQNYGKIYLFENISKRILTTTIGYEELDKLKQPISKKNIIDLFNKYKKIAEYEFELYQDCKTGDSTTLSILKKYKNGIESNKEYATFKNILDNW